MTKTEVLAMLKKNRNERGVVNWNKLGPKSHQLKSFGIGLTQLRKFAKEIGRNHNLARQLWNSDLYEAKVLGLLIDDPKQMTREQAEEQVEQLNAGLFAHVFASCNSTLAKAPFALELARDWMESQHNLRRRCGYTLIYELSKKKNIADDAWFMDRILVIRDTIHDQEMWVKEAMKGALLGIGKRNKKLNKAAIAAVKTMGDVDVDYGADNNCEPLDVMKHLTSDYLKRKFAK